MKLTPEDIEEFKAIYLQEFGEELSDAAAEQRARQLLAFYEVIYHILIKHRCLRSPDVDLHDPSAKLGVDRDDSASDLSFGSTNQL